jgi:hypothetical protein
MRRAAATVAAAALVLSAMTPAPAAADERLARLPPDQQALARRMVAFMDDMDRRQFGRVDRLNGAGAAPERLQRETDDSIYDVTVTRGPVVEKFGRMIAEGKKSQPGRREGEIVWSRFYSLDGHARSPLVGMLHATLVLQFYTDGSASAVGWLGVMNGTRVDADMQRLTRVVDEHFAAYGRDPTVYRKLMVKGTDETIADFRRRPDPAGVSFYGPPVFPGDAARSYEFVEGLFTKFTDAWIDLAEQHRNDAGTPADVAAQEAMRKRWLVDQLFSDPFAKELVPFEVWSTANVPPVIRF